MAGEAPKYLAWVRGQPCTVGQNCEGTVEAHHITGAGMGLRADDSQAMPLCRKHHHELHSHTGYFRRMKKDEKKAWQRHRVAKLRFDYDGEPLF